MRLHPYFGKVKLAFADPPYNFGVRYQGDATKDKIDEMDYKRWVEISLKDIETMLAPEAVLFWLCPSSHLSILPPLLDRCISDKGCTIIKEERFSQYQKKTLTDDFRLLFMRYIGSTFTFNPQSILIPSARQEKYKDKRAVPTGRVPGRVWNFRRLQGTSTDHIDWHPAQLPPELLHRIIKGWSNPGDLTMDCFAGSGNWGLAAHALGRDALLLDKSEEYCGKMMGRLTQAGIALG